LIYSESTEEHVEHVRKVLEKLLEHGLYACLEKCQFHVQEVDFLGYVITPGGVSMEKDKVATIVDWPVPKSVHDIQVFLGFANFYRRFIQAYSRVVLPITSLLRKTTNPFEWTSEAQAAFERLKLLFTEAPILRHFDPDLPVFLYTDASGFATSAILCQKHDGQLHPVAFWSRKSNPAECNYDIHDREMLAIVLALGHWRHYCEGAKHTVTIFTDHKNLEVFMSTKVLNRRQARWAELLSGYDFVLVHTPGSSNPADGPSRRPDYATDVPQPSGSLLPPSVFQSSAQVFRLSASLSVFTPESSLRQQFIDAYDADAIAAAQKKSITDGYQWRNDLLLYKSRIYVPHSLRLDVLRIHHDDPLAGHFGIARTQELLSRNYWFPSMSSFVEKYVSTCDICSRGKPSRHLKHGELMPLPVPPGPWKGITCDFVTDLPVSNGHDSLLVFVDRFTKMTHIIPCNKTTDAPAFARMFLDHVVRLHGLPDSLVSDRGSIFTSRFWKCLCQLLGIKGRLSTAFHPQTDGQTERMNQTIEQYLRIYCNYQQDNWSQLLSLAEFAYNNAFQASIKCSPFFASYGFHPSFHVNLGIDLNPENPAAKDYADQLKAHHDSLVETVKSSQDTQARYYDAKHKRIEFAAGDKVWLLSPNIRTERPSKKLDWKRLGPYIIEERIGLQAYRLKLPSSMKVHPVFHVSLLDPYKSSTIPDRTQDPPPPVVVDDELEWEVEEILDSKFRRRQLFYKVRWINYPPSDDSWQPASDLANSQDLVDEFHSRYPNKPRSLSRARSAS
jgi:transposase InsO family protein